MKYFSLLALVLTLSAMTANAADSCGDNPESRSPSVAKDIAAAQKAVAQSGQSADNDCEAQMTELKYKPDEAKYICSTGGIGGCGWTVLSEDHDIQSGFNDHTAAEAAQVCGDNKTEYSQCMALLKLDLVSWRASRLICKNGGIGGCAYNALLRNNSDSSSRTLLLVDCGIK